MRRARDGFWMKAYLHLQIKYLTSIIWIFRYFFVEAVALESSLNIYFAMHGLVRELCCLKYNWNNIMFAWRHHGDETLQELNPSPTSAAYMRRWIGTALVQIMACRLFGTEPLSKPMLVYCQLDLKQQTSVKFEWKYIILHWWKCIWKCLLRNGRPFCPGEISKLPNLNFK